MVLPRCFFLALAAVASLCAQDDRALRPASGTRLALLIGNDSHSSVPLPNAVNDARAMQAALAQYGFTTTLVTDSGLEAAARAIESFVARVEAGDAALVYYSDHRIAAARYMRPLDLRFVRRSGPGLMGSQ